MRRSPEEATVQLISQLDGSEVFEALVRVYNSRRRAAGAIVGLAADTYLDIDRPGVNEFWEDLQDLREWREYVEVVIAQGDFEGDAEILAGIADGIKKAETRADERFGHDIVYRVNS